MIYKLQKKMLLFVLLLASMGAVAQPAHSISLDQCFELAKQNYPLIKQFALIENTQDYSIASATRSNLPQIHIVGQATHQSEVTQIPISLPGMQIPTMSKDQLRLYGEVSQSITDLFTLKDQKEYIHSTAAIENQKLEVELYSLRERINQLYFGILLIDAQLKQTELVKKDLQNGIDRAQVAITNGVALKSTADNLWAELLKIAQRSIEQKASRKGYLAMLALFINQPLNENTQFERPVQPLLSSTIKRPELKLFELQKASFDVQNKLITAKNLPRISVFMQGGWGRPGLNMLDNDFKGYYIGGLRLNWNITGFYTSNNEKNILANRQKQIGFQEETFLFNTNIALKQIYTEVAKMQELIKTDQSIVEIRERVKHATQNQLTYGIATTNDYLLAVSAEDQAKQNLILHEIQLLMISYNSETITGN